MSSYEDPRPRPAFSTTTTTTDDGTKVITTSQAMNRRLNSFEDGGSSSNRDRNRQYVDPRAPNANDNKKDSTMSSSSTSSSSSSMAPPRPRSQLPPHLQSRGVLSNETQQRSNNNDNNYDDRRHNDDRRYNDDRRSYNNNNRRDNNNYRNNNNNNRYNNNNNNRYDDDNNNNNNYRRNNNNNNNNNNQQQQQQQQPQQPAQLQHNPQLVASTRVYRRLYVGNLPPLGAQLTEALIFQYFTKYMEGLKFTTPQPVLSVQLNDVNKNFCFVEFRSVLDTDAVYHLMQGAQMGPNQLKLNRPKDFHGVPANLKGYIVGHAPGSYLPPFYNGSLPILPGSEGQDDGMNYNHNSQQTNNINNMLNMNMNNMVLSIEDELKLISELNKNNINDVLKKMVPLLTPLSLINQPLIDTTIKNASTIDTTPCTIVQITNFINTSLSTEMDKLCDDIEWLNMSDDIIQFLHQELSKILYDTNDAKTNFFTDIIIPRPNQPNTTEPNVTNENGIYTMIEPTTLSTHRVIAPWHDEAQKYLGSCFIVCTTPSTAETVLHVLSQSIYSQQLIYPQFCSKDVITQLTNYLTPSSPTSSTSSTSTTPSMSTDNNNDSNMIQDDFLSTMNDGEADAF